jgi:hypothetical protein
MQVPLLLAIEGFNDMTTKAFLDPTIHVLKLPVQRNAPETDRAIPRMWSCARSEYDGHLQKRNIASVARICAPNSRHKQGTLSH